MRTKPHDISAGQLIMMLVLCSIFTMFSYTSGTRETLSAPAAPLVLLLSSAGALVVIIPFFLLKKHAFLTGNHFSAGYTELFPRQRQSWESGLWG